jgi:hypothetical protein
VTREERRITFLHPDVSPVTIATITIIVITTHIILTIRTPESTTTTAPNIHRIPFRSSPSTNRRCRTRRRHHHHHRRIRIRIRRRDSSVRG